MGGPGEGERGKPFQRVPSLPFPPAAGGISYAYWNSPSV
jgi:hypothetical protein